MADTDPLAIALLAAGASRRFGAADKLAAPLAGRPLIAWAADAGRSVAAVHRLVVTAPDFPEALVPPDYCQLLNPDAAEGLAASVRIAADHAGRLGASALLILLADMPLVEATHLARLVEAGRQAPDRAIFSATPGGAPQPPALFAAAHFADLLAMTGDTGARRLARDALLMETAADRLIDVDTPDDLARAETLLAGR